MLKYGIQFCKKRKRIIERQVHQLACREKSMQLMDETGMKAYEIAEQVGIKDAHYFSYLFKKTQGMTPSDYRKAREDKA